MKLKQFILLLLFFFTINVHSQNWESLNGGANNQCFSIFGDTTNNILYASGWFDSIGGKQARRIGQWNGVDWDSLNGGLKNVATISHSFTLYKGQLVSADFMFSQFNQHIAKWDGTQWDSIGSNFSASFFGVTALDSELYAYGAFDVVNGTSYNSIAKWDSIGGNWVSLGFPYSTSGSPPYIRTIAMYNNELYVGGLFGTIAGVNDNIAKYDGVSWSIVGGGIHGSMDQVFDLEVYQNELYACGQFKVTSGNVGNFIARWDGTAWNDVGGGVTGFFGQVMSMVTLNNKLYAGGQFEEIGGIPAIHIAAWDGTDWCGFGNTDSASVGCLATMGGDLYLTCHKKFDGVTVNYIAKWIGGSFVDTCGNLSVGINEAEINSKALNIYPNPATNQILIEFELTETKNVSFEIRNVLGQSVKALPNNIFAKGRNKIEVGISEFSSGIYFIQILNNEKFISTKFIKE